MSGEYSPRSFRASTRRRRPGAGGAPIAGAAARDHQFGSAAAAVVRRARAALYLDPHAAPVGRTPEFRPPHGTFPGPRVSRPALVLVEPEARELSALRERIAAICPPEMEVVAAGSAEEALGALYALRDQNRPIELVIAKQSMPGITGSRFLEIVNSQFPAVGKILLSDRPSLDEAVYALNNAGLDKYIPTPWDADDIKFTITALLRQREMRRLNERLLADLQTRNQQLTTALGNLEQARRDLEQSYIQTVESLAVALEAKDRYTAGHSQRVARFSRLIARSLGLPREEVDIVGQVALLHDIGKIGMLDKILNKPANLTADEREAIKSHPVVGAQILAPVRTFEKHIAGIRHHHEMYDGSGYPDRLKGEEIPLAARIVTLADAFDAMTSTRPYRVGLPLEFAMREMQKMAGRQFCPACVDAFVRVLKSTGVVEQEQDPDAAALPAAGEPGDRAPAAREEAAGGIASS
jgi:putative nucleotidyltransferase with HDIG domain